MSNLYELLQFTNVSGSTCKISLHRIYKPFCWKWWTTSFTGLEEPVRLLWFWPDQYFKFQQYYFYKNLKKNTYRNVETWRVIVLCAQGGKTSFWRLLNAYVTLGHDYATTLCMNRWHSLISALTQQAQHEATIAHAYRWGKPKQK